MPPVKKKKVWDLEAMIQTVDAVRNKRYVKDERDTADLIQLRWSRLPALPEQSESEDR